MSIFKLKYLPHTALVLISIGLYFPSLFNDFVYDDIAIIINDPYIHDPYNMRDIVTLKILKRDMMDQNRPVYVLSTMIDSIFWGKKPFGYHLTNVLLNGFVVLLLFIFTKKYIQNIFSSKAGTLIQEKKSYTGISVFSAVLLFVLHPINAETVSCVTYREDILVNLFILCSLLCTDLFNSDKKVFRAAGAFLTVTCSVLAFGAKESGYITPVLLFIYWYFTKNKKQAVVWLITIGTSAVFLILYIHLVRMFSFKGESMVFWATPSYVGGSFQKALLYIPTILVFQFSHFVLPINLSADYTAYSLHHFPPAVAIPIVLLIVTGAIWYSIKNKNVRFIFCLIILTILPISNIIPLFQPVADRFLYTPMIGIIILLSIMFTRYLNANRLPVFTVITASVFLILGYLTVKREIVWKNEMNLWTDTISNEKYSSAAARYLGVLYTEKGAYDLALKYLSRASFLEHDRSAEIFADMAVLFEKKGDEYLADSSYIYALNRNQRFSDMAKIEKTLRFSKNQIEILDRISKRVLPESR